MLRKTYLKLISWLSVKFPFIIETLFSLNSTETQGIFLKLTYFKFLLSPTVKVPYQLGRTVRGVEFDASKDIYSKVVKEILNDVPSKKITEMLFDEYQRYKNKTVIDLNNFLTVSKIISYPSWLTVLPWENSNISSLKKNYLNSFYKNRSANGMTFLDEKSESIEAKIFSYDTASSHVNQFKDLIKKIKNQGYIENKNDYPSAIILIKGNEWKWMMSSSGNHRAHIKRELDHNFINCRVTGVVNFSKLSKCKNVLNHIFDENEATILFENVFKGKIPVRGPI
jgi:hypothetical protein